MGNVSASEYAAPSWISAFAARTRPACGQLINAGVGFEGNKLQARLSTVDRAELTPEMMRHEIEGSLWMLAPEAFCYFLPVFLSAGVAHYDRLTAFVAELVSALTEPRREDVVLALDRLEQVPVDLFGIDPEPLGLLRQQQLEWFDSGHPVSLYHSRIDTLTDAESATILHFLITIRDRHGDDFPFGELDVAIERRWGRYQHR
jgi:hypothetical protein